MLLWIFTKGFLRSSSTGRLWLTKLLVKGEDLSGKSLTDEQKKNLKSKVSGTKTKIEKNNKKNTIKYKGIPTRLKAALILSVFMTTGMAWRIGGMFSHLLEGVEDMYSLYKVNADDPWNAIKPLLNVQNLSSLANQYQNARPNKDGTLSAYQIAFEQELTSFASSNVQINSWELLTGSTGAKNSGTKGLQQVLLMELPTSVTDLQKYAGKYVINNLAAALNASALNKVDIALLNNFVPMNQRQLYLGAKSSFSACSQRYVVDAAKKMLIQTTFGFSGKVLQALIKDPNSKNILSMTTIERTELLKKAVVTATVASFQQCPSTLHDSIRNMSTCLANATMNTLLNDDSTAFNYQTLLKEDQTGGACTFKKLFQINF